MELKDIEEKWIETGLFKERIKKIMSSIDYYLNEKSLIEQKDFEEIINSKLTDTEKLFKHLYLNEIENQLKDNQILNIKGNLVDINMFLKFKNLFETFSLLENKEKEEIMSQILENNIWMILKIK